MTFWLLSRLYKRENCEDYCRPFGGEKTLRRKITDVSALRALLIDFTYAGRSVAGQVLIEKNPGGAPANIQTAVARQGRQWRTD